MGIVVPNVRAGSLHFFFIIMFLMAGFLSGSQRAATITAGGFLIYCVSYSITFWRMRQFQHFYSLNSRCDEINQSFYGQDTSLKWLKVNSSTFSARCSQRKLPLCANRKRKKAFWQPASPVNHYTFSMCLNHTRWRDRLQFLCTACECVCVCVCVCVCCV